MVATATLDRVKLQSPNVIPAALHALHWMIANARREALDCAHGRKNADPQRMVDLLDAVETVSDLIKHNQDGSYEQLRTFLGNVGLDFPEYSGLLEQFDDDVSEPEEANSSAA